MPAGNALQQLSTVPVQSQPLVTKRTDKDEQRVENSLTFAWIQWFQSVYQAIKYLAGIVPGISSDAPLNQATPVGWLSAIDEATGETVFIPYYQ